LIYEWGVCNFLPVEMKNYIKFLLLFIVAALKVVNADYLKIEQPSVRNPERLIQILEVGNTRYLSVQDFSAAFDVRTYYRRESGKIVLFFPQNKIKITANNNFIMFDAQVFQMSNPALLIDDKVYVPLNSFLELVKQKSIPSVQYSIAAENEPVKVVANAVDHSDILWKVRKPGLAQIKGIRYEEKANGVTVRIGAEGTFTDADLTTFFKGSDWLFMTIYGATGDSLALSAINPTNSFQRVEAIAVGSSVQLGFQLNRQFKSADAHYDLRTGEIILALFLPLDRDIKRKIEEAKTAWIIDTIVLDPGHGGKDPGTPGRWGYMDEKDIVLDVARRVGKRLERHNNLKVVYTRKTDEFIPLWKRAEIANKANGKLFISLHVNGLKNNNSADGVEFYLLRPGRSEDAIRVAEAENSVIQLEEVEDKVRYAGYDDITNILANMVHSVNMKDSELFASILSDNFTERVKQKNRGVKQAGFYVLVGADMPKVLCELGFNSNREEARKLSSSRHRDVIAEAVYRSILKFKEECDRSIAAGS
jgi:N-acetylmuramoyl-L-alanine amidase